MGVIQMEITALGDCEKCADDMVACREYKYDIYLPLVALNSYK